MSNISAAIAFYRYSIILPVVYILGEFGILIYSRNPTHHIGAKGQLIHGQNCTIASRSGNNKVAMVIDIKYVLCDLQKYLKFLSQRFRPKIYFLW